MWERKPLCCFLEYAGGGSLYDYLLSDESEKMDIGQIMNWAAEIARGTFNMNISLLNKTLKPGKSSEWLWIEWKPVCVYSCKWKKFN